MDGDLSLSQSFGGLRIANPDGLSPVSSIELNLARSLSPLSETDSPQDNTDKLSSSQISSTIPTNGAVRPQSPLGYNSSSILVDVVSSRAQGSSEKLPLTPSKERTSYAQRQSNRQSIPLTYQDQQQAQFPQYPTMMPLSQRHPGSTARPASTIYSQIASSGGDLAPKEGSYRLRSESSRSSAQAMPQRSSSRGAAPAMQAGVPIRDGSYMDRSYRQSPHAYNGNGTLPPRSSSQGIGVSQANGSRGFLPPLSLGSPYGLEDGPLVSSEEWQEKGAAVRVREELDRNGQTVLRSVKKGVKDFHFGRTLGEGSYSTVIAATDRQNLHEYAIKVLDKRHIIKEKKVKYVNIEKDTLNKLTEHPGIVRLYYTFQDQQSLYFVLDLASGGELLGVLKRMTTFDEECTRFYAAEILDTVDYMHAQGIIHRDLKPENVLLDDKMHVKITDFGTAKMLDAPQKDTNGIRNAGLDQPPDVTANDRASSFVGTAEYVSPELLNHKGACKASDLWALGCIIYQLLVGRPPFKAANEFLTFQKILALDYTFPPGFPDVARDLVERLLVPDPSRRLSIHHIKNHQFFDGITWGPSLWKQKAPRLKSFVPLSQDSPKSNGHPNGNASSFPPNISTSHSTAPTRFDGAVSNGASRAGPRLITELPPPSQLDIAWSPVLTKTNERILKLGNLLVLSSPALHSPSNKNGVPGSDTDTPKKFSRFFGSSAPKKRQRLVMVTSSARIVIAAAGGEEKKAKAEIALLSDGCGWRTMQDPKGLTYWCVDTVSVGTHIIRVTQSKLSFQQDKHITFEDPKSASSDGSATTAMAQEWLATLETAREMAISQSISMSATGDEVFRDLQSGISNTPRNLDLDSPPGDTSNRHALQKYPSSNDVDSLKGRKRFSKRQSKNGLAAVF